MKKNLKVILISVAVIVILILLALPKIHFSSGSEQNNDPSSNQFKALPIKAHILNFQRLANKVLTTGTVMANEEVELKSEVSGKIIKILFREGSYVKEGDLLVKINDSELQAQLTREKYNLKLLEDKEYRQRKLLEKEAISKEDYDDALNNLNVSKAQVELIEAQIEKTEIKAPFNGLVGLKNVSVGSFVTSSTVIATLQNINPIKIEFSVPEKYSSEVKVGDEINFTVTGNEQNYVAKIYAIEPKIDPVTRTLKMRAKYTSNTQGDILPGAFADVELILNDIKDALMIPSYALVPELKGQKVFVYKNGKAVSVDVETGIRTDNNIQITKGLNDKDTVITSGILQLRPGAPVTVSEFN